MNKFDKLYRVIMEQAFGKIPTGVEDPAVSNDDIWDVINNVVDNWDIPEDWMKKHKVSDLQDKCFKAMEKEEFKDKKQCEKAVTDWMKKKFK